MNPISTEIIQVILQGAGAFLVGHGWLAANQEQGFIGSVFFLIGIGWSAYEKLAAKRAP